MYTQTRNLHFILAVILFMIIGCRSEKDIATSEQKKLEDVNKSMDVFARKSATYREFPIEIAFFDPVADKASIKQAIEQRRAFIRQSGLPDETNIAEFQRTKTTDDAYQLYQKHLRAYPQSPYSKTFRQFGAWLILTRLDLLAQTNPKSLDMTYQLLRELTGSGYEGYALLAYSLQHLHQNGFNANKLRPLAQEALELVKTKPQMKAKTTPDAEAEKKLPPEIQASLTNYRDLKTERRENALRDIEKLLSVIIQP